MEGQGAAVGTEGADARQDGLAEGVIADGQMPVDGIDLVRRPQVGAQDDAQVIVASVPDVDADPDAGASVIFRQPGDPQPLFGDAPGIEGLGIENELDRLGQEGPVEKDGANGPGVGRGQAVVEDDPRKPFAGRQNRDAGGQALLVGGIELGFERLGRPRQLGIDAVKDPAG